MSSLLSSSSSSFSSHPPPPIFRMGFPPSLIQHMRWATFRKKKPHIQQRCSVEDALRFVRACATAKFDETLDAAVNLNVDVRQADQIIRGTAFLPHGTGKTVRVAVFAKDDQATRALEAGADVVGAEQLVDQIKDGIINFDRCIATTDMKTVIAKVARILGPRGLMPNPKNNTLTDDVEAAVRNLKAGQIAFRTDKAGIVHVGLGKLSFSNKALKENLAAFLRALQLCKPAAVRRDYFLAVALSSTMGPGVFLDLQKLELK